jgi:hypothetical protein
MKSTSHRLLAVKMLASALLMGWSVLQNVGIAEAQKVDAPVIVQKDGRFALLVEGQPYLMLGGQIHNSSAWPGELPQVWQSMAELHANTLEAPVYWEQMEPREGEFDFSNVDQLIEGARAHDLHVVLLWFATWKNGNMHYAPAWVKGDAKRFPHTIRPDGEPTDVLSPLGQATLEADKSAFTALMHHLKQIDADRHTVLMIQVENESGNIGSIRDNSATANRVFDADVPEVLLKITHKSSGSWRQVFKGEADEIFQIYYQARYIQAVAAAGKAEFPIPCTINVWLNYPAAQLPQRQLSLPGTGYPSGGAVQAYVDLWKALAPALDVIAPDIYDSSPAFYRSVLRAYRRADNPLMVPETGRSDEFAKYFYEVLGEGAIGFAPFGVDRTGWNITGDQPWKLHARNFELFQPMAREIARLNFEGKIKTTIEEPGKTTQELDFDGWSATVSFGFPQADGRPAPGTPDAHGAAMIAQIGPDQFLVTGTDASVVFHLPHQQPWMHSMITTAEQGVYAKGKWIPIRLWNGDETDRGLCFYQKPEVVQVRMARF